MQPVPSGPRVGDRQCPRCPKVVPRAGGWANGMCAACDKRRARLADLQPKACARPGCTGIVERRGRRIYCPACLVTHRPHARGLAKGGSDGISGLAILDRDGWLCQMPEGFCLLPSRVIDPEAGCPAHASAVVDHIWPRSLGGADTAPNKRAAHWLCNNSRGDRIIEPAPPGGWLIAVNMAA